MQRSENGNLATLETKLEKTLRKIIKDKREAIELVHKSWKTFKDSEMRKIPVLEVREAHIQVLTS